MYHHLFTVNLLQAVGDGSVAQLVLSKGTHANFFSVTFAWAMAITFGVYISGNTSGKLFSMSYLLYMSIIYIPL